MTSPSTYKYLFYTLAYLVFASWFASFALLTYYDYHAMIWPYHIYHFALAYYPDYPHTRTPFWIAIALALFPLLGLIWRVRRPDALHGDARWASLREIIAMGLIDLREQSGPLPRTLRYLTNKLKALELPHPKELFRLTQRQVNGFMFCNFHLGRLPFFRKRYLLADSSVEHVSVVAPTRSGKGVGVVIPNLLEWQGSAVVLDIKFENYQITAHRRGHDLGNEVYFFSPGNPNSHCWNPIDLIDLDDPFALATLDMIAQTLCPDSPKADQPMWTIEGRNIFKAALLYLMCLARYHREPNPSFGELNAWIRLKTDEEQMEQVLQGIENDDKFAETLPKICVVLLKNYIMMPDKQRLSVQTTITSQLSLYDDPAINAAVSRSDFDVRDLRRKKMTIYLGANPKTLTNLGPLFGMFFELASNELTAHLPSDAPPDNPEPHKVLLLMDEFTSMGEMKSIKKGIAFFAGYHVRLIIIIQGTSQLETVYGASGLSEFLANFKFQFFFAPNDPKEAKALSDALGTDTVRAYSRSLPGLLSKSDKSYNESEQARALLTPDEVTRLDRTKAILRVEAQRPIYADKIVYWKDPFFKRKFWNIIDNKAKKKTAHRKPPTPPKLNVTHTTVEERIAAKKGLAREEEQLLRNISNKFKSGHTSATTTSAKPAVKQSDIATAKAARKRREQAKLEKDMPKEAARLLASSREQNQIQAHIDQFDQTRKDREAAEQWALSQQAQPAGDTPPATPPAQPRIVHAEDDIENTPQTDAPRPTPAPGMAYLKNKTSNKPPASTAPQDHTTP